MAAPASGESEPAATVLPASENGRHEAGSSAREILWKVTLGLSYILASGSMIRFNKFLVSPGHFPFVMFLTSLHMLSSSLLCLLFYMLLPQLFPGVESSGGRRDLLFKWIPPIAATFASSLFASNHAYFYCNVAFLQFMKEANVIITFLISCAVGLQVLDRVRFALIAWIICACAVSVTGEVRFVFLGFVFQAVSQLCECSRIVMSEIVLTGAGLKLDPLSFALIVSPACCVVLLVGSFFTWDPAIPGALVQWWHYVLPNCLLASMLNLIVATSIKEFSALGATLLGVCKDVFLVMASCILYGEPVTTMQRCSFALTLAGVCLWSHVKTFPDGAAVVALSTFLGVSKLDKMVPTESSRLIPSPGKLV